MSVYKVLVVDDDTSALTLLDIMLKRSGFEAVVAENATQALEQLDKTVPDLIILDYMLPGMNGVELCRTIRQREDTANIPILMLSARGDKGVVTAAKEAGITDHLMKPLLIHEVTEKLTTIIETTGSSEEL